MDKEKKYILWKFLLIACLLVCVDGCGGDKPKYTPEELAEIPFPQRDGLPQVSGGFVLAVGDETITADEIIAPFIERFREPAQRMDLKQFDAKVRTQIEQVLTDKVSDILLYNEAKKNLGENLDETLEKAAKTEVRKFIVSFGGDWAKAEQVLKRDGMDWAGFEKYQRRIILSQSYVSSQLPKQKSVTYSELLNYYNRIKHESFTTPATIKFRLIDIQPSGIEVTDTNTTAPRQAKKLADELVKRIRAGENFSELAKQYSNGHRKMFGGLWKAVQPDSLASPYDILAKHAEKIEPGQIAGPIETDEHIFIMKLEEKNAEGVKPLEEVQKEIKAAIIFDQRKKAVDELMAKLTQQAKIAQKDEFVDFCLQKMYLLCNR